MSSLRKLNLDETAVDGAHKAMYYLQAARRERFCRTLSRVKCDCVRIS